MAALDDLFGDMQQAVVMCSGACVLMHLLEQIRKLEAWRRRRESSDSPKTGGWIWMLWVLGRPTNILTDQGESGGSSYACYFDCP